MPSLDALLDRALELKAAPRSSNALGRSLRRARSSRGPRRARACPSRSAIVELGGHPLVLRGDEMQLSRGEPLRDTALVLSRHVDAVGVRTGPQATLEELARHGAIPVFNMLTAEHHPCQALADLLTLREAFGALDGLRLAYVGDGNNVARSLALLGALAGVEVVVASPEGYELEAGAGATLVRDPARGGARRARRLHRRLGLDGRRGDRRRPPRGARRLPGRRRACSTSRARTRSPCTTCRRTPARRSPPRCSTAPRQRIWDQAENRRHAQKAMLEWLLGMSAAAAPRRARAVGDELELRDRVARLRRRRRRAHRRRLRRLRRRRLPRRSRPRPRPRPQALLRARPRRSSCSRPDPTASQPLADHPGRAVAGAPLRAPARDQAAARSTTRCGGSATSTASRSTPIVAGAVEQWRYRNKLEYSFGARRRRRAGVRLPRARLVGADRAARGLPARLRARQRGAPRGARRSAARRASSAFDRRTRRGLPAQPRRPRGAPHRPAPGPARHRPGRARPRARWPRRSRCDGLLLDAHRGARRRPPPAASTELLAGHATLAERLGDLELRALARGVLPDQHRDGRAALRARRRRPPSCTAGSASSTSTAASARSA